MSEENTVNQLDKISKDTQDSEYAERATNDILKRRETERNTYIVDCIVAMTRNVLVRFDDGTFGTNALGEYWALIADVVLIAPNAIFEQSKRARFESELFNLNWLSDAKASAFELLAKKRALEINDKLLSFISPSKITLEDIEREAASIVGK